MYVVTVQATGHHTYTDTYLHGHTQAHTGTLAYMGTWAHTGTSEQRHLLTWAHTGTQSRDVQFIYRCTI